MTRKFAMSIALIGVFPHLPDAHWRPIRWKMLQELRLNEPAKWLAARTMVIFGPMSTGEMRLIGLLWWASY